MQKYQLDLEFKGDRNYIQGGDLFICSKECMNQAFSGWMKKIVFRGFATKQCLLVLEKPTSSEKIIATIDWQLDDGEQIKAWITETSEAIKGRYKFDEALITDVASIEGESVMLEKPTPFTTIENIIALTKHLNYSLSPNVSGKWVFGQLNLMAPLPEKWSVINILRISEIKNKFSRNTIQIDGSDLGEIRFIVGEP